MRKASRKPDRPPSSSSNQRLLTTTFVALASALSLWAYLPSSAGVFVMDDVPAIVENPHIRSLSPSQSLTAPSRATTSGRPIASFSFALNYALAPAADREAMSPGRGDAFYRNVWGYHALNFLIHLLAGLTLFGVVRRTLLTEKLRDRWAPFAFPVAASVSLVWLVHPLATEAVTYIVQRCESLMSLWFLLTLYAAIRARESGATTRFWTIAAVGACALGMGTKEMMVGAPLVVMAWDRCCSVDRPRLRLYMGLAATWLVTLGLLSIESEATTLLSATQASWTRSSYLLTQAGIILHYMRLVFWPAPLAFDYHGWPPADLGPVLAVQASVVIAAVLATGYGLRRRHPLAVCGVIFFAVLAPTSSIFPIPTEVAAEHRMYLPLAAVLAVVASLAVAGARRFLSPANTRSALMVSALVLAAAASVETRARNREYSSDQTLWRTVVEARPTNARARINYGRTLMQSGRYVEAQAQMESALSLRMDRPMKAEALVQLGAALGAQGRMDDGITRLNEAIAADPTVPDVNLILGQAYADKKDDARAVTFLGKANDERPGTPLLLARLSWILATTRNDAVRDGARAAKLAEEAAQRTHAQDPFVLSSLAAAYAELGKFREAAEVLSTAMDLSRASGNADFLRFLDQQRRQVLAGQKIRD